MAKEMAEKIAELQARKERVRRGNPAAIEKLHQQGMLSARERLEAFLDPGSFVELDLLVTHHSTEFGLAGKEIPAEGVVVGYGKVNGRLTFVYSQDFTALGGTYGEMHGRKICKIMEKALEVGAPVVGFNHSGGARLQELLGPVEQFGRLFFYNTLLSGVVPQISLVLGSVAGGQAYSPGLTDFIIMTKDSKMYIAGPAFVKTQIGEEATEEELGGAMMHASVSGVTDLVAEDEQACFEVTRKLLDFLPPNYREQPPRKPTLDPPSRETPELEEIIPVESKLPFDAREVIKRVVDEGDFLEIKPLYAPNIVVGFARFSGYPVGIVANQSLYFAGAIDVKAAEKTARFVRFCDCFNLPVVTFQDSPGYMIGSREEKQAMITRGSKLLHAYAEATVPLVTIIVRKAYAGAYIALGSKYIGGDQVFALACAEIPGLAPETFASIVLRRELAQAEDPEAIREQSFKDFQERFVNPYYAAAGQHIDDVIAPREIRPVVIQALEMLRNKRVQRPERKHSNIPL